MLCLAHKFQCVGHNYYHCIDRETLDAEVTKLREGLKPKVNQLHRMEGIIKIATVHNKVSVPSPQFPFKHALLDSYDLCMPLLSST